MLRIREFEDFPGCTVVKGEGNDNPLLLGKSHEWRSLAAYSPQSCKEKDTTEQLTHTVDKNPPANAGYMGLIPGLRRFHMLQSG